MNIEVRCPTRIDLAGGTLDCWPLHLFLKDPVTINLAIPVYASVRLTRRRDGSVIFRSADFAAEQKFDSVSSFLADRQSATLLTRTAIGALKPETGFEIESSSESPVGAGLGGSSALMIAHLLGLSRFLDRSFTVSEMVGLAANLEARMLEKPTGTQDYFPPLLGGGALAIHYEPRGPRPVRLSVDPRLFEGKLLVVYTGRSHNSGINNWDVIQSWLNGNAQTRSTLAELAEISREMLGTLVEGRSEAWGGLFERETAARLKLSAGFGSPEIDRLLALARRHGASVKICGAGGGGSCIVYAHAGVGALEREILDLGMQVLARGILQ